MFTQNEQGGAQSAFSPSFYKPADGKGVLTVYVPGSNNHSSKGECAGADQIP